MEATIEREFQDGEDVPGTAYRVLRLVGQGGMGSVYEVEHVELGKRFVLKALLRELAGRPDLVARLRNEWRALGKLEHANIVMVTDAGTTPTGVPYYVMERLEGETLSARLRREGRLALETACSIARDALDALHAAHEIGIVHRDVKPANVFLTRGGPVKLLDFGVAKITCGAESITARGVAIGTPRYMPPEQARGEGVDGRADLYAAGLVLFEMLVGKGPFDESRDPNDLLLAHLAREAPRLSTVRSGIPAELDALVAQLLAKRAAERPPSARAVCAVLDRVLRGRSSSESAASRHRDLAADDTVLARTVVAALAAADPVDAASTSVTPRVPVEVPERARGPSALSRVEGTVITERVATSDLLESSTAVTDAPTRPTASPERIADSRGAAPTPVPDAAPLAAPSAPRHDTERVAALPRGDVAPGSEARLGAAFGSEARPGAAPGAPYGAAHRGVAPDGAPDRAVHDGAPRTGALPTGALPTGALPQHLEAEVRHEAPWVQAGVAGGAGSSAVSLALKLGPLGTVHDAAPPPPPPGGWAPRGKGQTMRLDLGDEPPPTRTSIPVAVPLAPSKPSPRARRERSEWADHRWLGGALGLGLGVGLGIAGLVVGSWVAVDAPAPGALVAPLPSASGRVGVDPASSARAIRGLAVSSSDSTPTPPSRVAPNAAATPGAAAARSATAAAVATASPR